MGNPDRDKQRAFAEKVVRDLRAAGFEAYWAGGCVRDHLLGRPAKDYDVATDATPAEIRQLFGRRRTVAIGAAFGVITVLGPRGAGQIEVATFRQDAAYSDGRHPDSVTFSTAENDARRRDFTINGLFYDPANGQVIDYVAGQADLQRRVVRAIGDPYARIGEDKLRMLRAVRFAATLGFELDEATRQAVEKLADQLGVVSAERIAAEMRLMLCHERRAEAARMLFETGLLSVVLPDGIAPQEGPSWQQALGMLQNLFRPSFALALAALLVPWSDTRQAAKVTRAWKLSNHEAERLTWLVSHHAQLDGARQQPWPDIQPLLVDEGVAELLSLEAARVAVGVAGSDGLAYCRERLGWAAERLSPPPLITGDDLKKHGIAPGKAYKNLLGAVRRQQLFGQIETAAEALDVVDQLRQPPE